MKILKNAGTFEVLTKPESVIRDIAAAARTCYQSQDKANPENDIKLVKNLIARGHSPMLEFADLTVRFNGVSRFLTHELVRHRLASYAQECLSGDTEVKKGVTIKYLYDRSKTCYGKTHNKTMNLRSVDDAGIIINNKMIDILYKGKGIVYEVKTKLGYTIKTTLNHFFRTPQGYKELKTLNINDEVMVNGRSYLIPTEIDELKRMYLKEGLSPKEIEERTGENYRIVIYKLKKIGIFVRKLNDKNKEKYNHNTEDSYKRMKKTIKEQFGSGRIAWNRGLNENDHPSVKIQADALRTNHHDNGYDDNNSVWVGDNVEISGGYSRSNRWFRISEGYKCDICKKDKAIHRHHIDENPKNNSKQNLLFLCQECHTKIHKGWRSGYREHPDIIVDIKEVGEEDVYDIVMKNPHNNFVANGFIVHNSTRYVDEKEFEVIVPPHKDENELCGTGDDVYENTLVQWLQSHEDAYKSLREKGWKPEDARVALPSSIQAQIVIKANLSEWRHIFFRRCDKFAYWEIRVVMLELLKWCQQNIPVVFDDFYYFQTDEGTKYARKVLSKKALLEEIDHYRRATGDPETL